METAAFIDPRGNTRAHAREPLVRTIDLVLDHLADAASRTPSPEPRAFPNFFVLPETPLTEDELFERAQFVLRQSRNLAHPGYIGNMESMPTTMAVAGTMLMAASKNNMLAEEMAPFLTDVEPAVMRWFAGRFGLGANSGGGMLACGTLANLQALVTARNARLTNSRNGLWGRQRSPVVLASESAHTSLQKAAMVMGLGTSGVIPVHADEHSRMDIDDLQQKIRRSRDAGQEPFCVVATAGTTITGNIDPLPAIARVAAEHGLWLHTDAVYGGALAFSKTHRSKLDGIEQSDSVSFNLHKWAYLATTSSMILFKDIGAAHEHFHVAAPYMNAASPSKNLGEFSLQGSRQADIIPLLLSMQHLGMAHYARLVDTRIELAEHLRRGLEQTQPVEFPGAIDTNIVCFRPHKSTDAHCATLQNHLLKKAEVCLTLPHYRGQRWLKADVLNPFTDEHTIDRLTASLSTWECAS